MFPDPCGQALAEAVRNGADPLQVVPDDFVIVRGGSTGLPAPGTPFSGAVGPALNDAASAVPHGQVRVTTVGEIRKQGGSVEWMPETSRHGTVNQQHVNVVETGQTVFSELQKNPVPRQQRVDGDKSASQGNTP